MVLVLLVGGADNTLLKETFIIKGDNVVVYQHYKNYDYAMFINNRTGITTQGWILENALKTTGTMGGRL